jgi:hypothetical protein
MFQNIFKSNFHIEKTFVSIFSLEKTLTLMHFYHPYESMGLSSIFEVSLS